MSIKVKINQHFTLRSNIDRTRIATPPSDPRTVILLNASHPPNYGVIDVASLDTNKDQRSRSSTPSVGPLKVLSADQEWKIHHLARLPNDNCLRPSTQVGTESAISARHDIAVEVMYQVNNEPEEKNVKGKGKEKEKEKKITKKMVITKPLELYSVSFVLISCPSVVLTVKSIVLLLLRLFDFTALFNR